MGYVLLAIENLTVSLLFVALVVALAARCGRWTRRVWVAAAAALCLALYGVAMVADYNQEFVSSSARTGLFVPLLTMVALFVVGAAIIIRRGLRVGFTADGEAEGDLPPQPAARGWPRGRLALALGVAVVLNLMTLANLDAAARQSISALRSDAYALAMSVAPQPVPDDENAATYYLQVFQALDRENLYSERPDNRWHQVLIDADNALHASGGKFDFGSAELTEFIKAHQGEVDLLRTGAALPHYYYDRNYGQMDLSTLLPDIQAMRQGVWLLALHARWSAATGDTKSALADVTAISGLARHAAGDPFAVTLLVGFSLDGIAFDTLQTVLRSRTPAADALADARVNQLLSYRRQTNRILRGEEAAMLNTMIQIDSQLALSTAKWLGGTDPESTYFGHTSGVISVFGLGPFYRVFVLLPAMAAYRRGMERAYASTLLPYAEFKSRIERFEPELEGQGVFASAAAATLSTVKACYLADARNLVAYTALAMHRYRAQHGRFPETLDELAPEVIPIVPGDPYDEQLLKLAKTDHGWIVYSVGPDMTDDHGAPLDSQRQKGDIAFEYAEEEKPEG